MSWSWYLYSTRAPNEAVALEGEFDALLEAYYEEHDGDEEGCALPVVGGRPPPKPAEVVEQQRTFGNTVAAEILDRLEQCRTTVEFEYVRDAPEENAMQVSILRYWIERLSPCLVDWGDLTLESGESTLARLSRMRSRRLAPTPPPKPRPIKQRKERPGEVRAVRLLEQLDEAAGDPDAALDLRASLAKLSTDATAYIQLIVQEGAMSDDAARKKLGIDRTALERAIDEVTAVLHPSGDAR